jgi:hypothetical protein
MCPVNTLLGTHMIRPVPDSFLELDVIFILMQPRIVECSPNDATFGDVMVHSVEVADTVELTSGTE